MTEENPNREASPERVDANSDREAPQPFQPTRMRFQDRIRMECQQLVQHVLPDVPELAGIAFVFIWDPAMRSEGLDFGLILGRDTETPRFKLRSVEQVHRLLQWQMQAIHTDLMRADQMAQQLNRELHAKRQELDALDRQIREKKGEAGAAGQPSDDPPAGEPS